MGLCVLVDCVEERVYAVCVYCSLAIRLSTINISNMKILHIITILTICFCFFLFCSLVIFPSYSELSQSHHDCRSSPSFNFFFFSIFPLLSWKLSPNAPFAVDMDIYEYCCMVKMIAVPFASAQQEPWPFLVF